ncbi:MAG: hypothetical protein GY778_29225 [bacterium]|nr:hypothetical protein [bacterium]
MELRVEVVGASVNCDISGDIGQVTASVTAEGLVQVEILDDLPNDQECCTITLTGDVEDTFELRPLRGDVNFSGIVNATDKNLVKGKIGHPIDQGDNFIYDVNMSGTINATDKNLVKGWIGGNAGTCPGGGRGAGIGVDPLPAGIADGAPQTDGPGISALAGTQLELRPVDGSGEVTALTPYTTYEVHYDSDLDAVSDYILFAVATAPGQGLSAASAPSAGDWSATGQFTFIDFVDDWDAPISAPGYPAGYWRYQMVTDEAGPTGVPGSQGHLCSITTEGPGQFDLHLYLAWTDPATQVVVETQTQAAYTVASPGGGTGG